jgi:hypothetical protein
MLDVEEVAPEPTNATGSTSDHRTHLTDPSPTSLFMIPLQIPPSNQPLDLVAPPTEPAAESQATTIESLSQESISLPPPMPQRTSKRCRKPNPKYSDGMFRFAGIAKSYKFAYKGPDQDLWMKVADEEFHRLIETTETMKLIPWDGKPSDRKASYYNPQIRIKIKNDRSSEYRVRGTYGGDISDYQGPTTAQTADMVSIKILLNTTVSEDAKFMTMDIKDFYL